jgi:hypothetical protein
MSIPLGTYTVTKEERTYKFVGTTPKGAPPKIEVYRETTETDQTGVVLRRVEIPDVITRAPAQIVNDSVTLRDGTVVTALHVYEALPLFFDLWARQG